MASASSHVLVALAGVTLIISVWTAISTIRQYFRLQHIKGPRSAGFSKWWLIRAVGGGRTHLDLYEACEKYGMPATPFRPVGGWPSLLTRQVLLPVSARITLSPAIPIS